MSNDDKTLIQRINDGAAKDFGLLVNRYGQALMSFVGRIVGQQEDAEDVVQNTFVAAYEHWKSYDPLKASLSTWLQRIAYHEALYHLRKRKRQGTLQFEVSEDIPDELPETTTSERLDEAIQMLSPEEQMLLHLYYFDQLPLKDIGYITVKADADLPRETSRLSSQLYRIRQRLRIILTSTNNE